MKITHLVFDLGGVIVELRGLPILPEWTGSNESSDAPDLLHALKPNYTLAFFSNSNEIHWPLKMGSMQLDTAFHHNCC